MVEFEPNIARQRYSDRGQSRRKRERCCKLCPQALSAEQMRYGNLDKNSNNYIKAKINLLK